MDTPNFKDALKHGKVTHENGYHDPHEINCGCDLTTRKGAYRDITVKMDNGTIVHFYHQTPVVVEYASSIILNSGGYQTKSTKERINRYSPYRVFQRDKEWYVKKDGKELEFKDGMVLTV